MLHFWIKIRYLMPHLILSFGGFAPEPPPGGNPPDPRTRDWAFGPTGMKLRFPGLPISGLE